jgi:hypothetical protein
MLTQGNAQNKKLEAAGLRVQLTKSGVPVKAAREMKQCKICKAELVAAQALQLQSHADNKHPKNSFADCFA